MKFISVIIFIFAAQASAQSFSAGGGFGVRNNTETVSWTLADWLNQKQKFKLQDQWLAVNTQANLYEFGLNGGQASYEKTVNGVTNKYTMNQISASFWFSIFGLEYVRNSSAEDFVSQSGQFNIRLLGQSASSTNLKAFYGVRKTEYKNPDNEITNNYAGADLRLYIFQFFGVTAGYEKSFQAEDNSMTAYEGQRVDYGAFIELGFVRLSGTYFTEDTYVTPSGGSESKQSREGVLTGLQFYL